MPNISIPTWETIAATITTGTSVRWRKEHLNISKLSDVSANWGDVTSGNGIFGTALNRHIEIGDGNAKGFATYDTKNRPFYRTGYVNEFWRLGLADRPQISYNETTGSPEIDGDCNKINSIPVNRIKTLSFISAFLSTGNITIPHSHDSDYNYITIDSDGIIIASESNAKNTNPLIKFRSIDRTLSSPNNISELNIYRHDSGFLAFESGTQQSITPGFELRNYDQSKIARLGTELIQLFSSSKSLYTSMGNRILGQADTDFDTTGEVRIGPLIASYQTGAMLGVDAFGVNVYGGDIYFKPFVGISNRSIPDNRPTPADGVLVIHPNLDTGKLEYWNGSTWSDL